MFWGISLRYIAYLSFSLSHMTERSIVCVEKSFHKILVCWYMFFSSSSSDAVSVSSSGAYFSLNLRTTFIAAS